ncbi:hypothetical protein BCR43DRAFT_435831 [Syncephalastrum racemosum]|uniref:Uncharacterized protein n=1 Tax=Syncephalastrum racemosum TaxID=13706 RepID=A0A1X2HLI7_SYNRA|nr:hypothetical protein BCR43DRAFT_435831 [Syncephalastrum racemosum]
MDGIGTAVLDNVERVLLESSGDADDMHTNEDTLKLLEYTSLCLQTEKSRYQQASHDTFVQRRLFGIQFVGYKLTLLSTFISQDDRWACLWERSAIIPHRWEERKFWLQAFELIVKLMDLIAEQDRITQQLIDEHTGSAIVLKGNTLRSYYSRHAFAPPPRSEDLIQALPL